MNVLRIIIGLMLLIPALIVSFFIGGQEDSKPWSDGLLRNTLRAYKRYTPKSWMRRMIYIFKNPRVVDQYLKILSYRRKCYYMGRVMVRVDRLISSHDVDTTHKHHRDRVELYKQGKKVESFSPIIVVDHVIHDGHHRVRAMLEANIEWAMVDYYGVKP